MNDWNYNYTPSKMGSASLTYKKCKKLYNDTHKDTDWN